MKCFARSRNEDDSLLFSSEDLKRLLIPLVLEQLLAVTMGIINTIMVSSVGEAAVSGISVVETINLLLVNVFAALATGGAVIVSQYLGRKELDMAGQAAKQLLYTMLLVSLLISAFSLVSHRFLLQIIYPGIEPDVMGYAQVYFLITAFSFPFLSVFSGSCALLRAVGNSKAPLNTSLLMNVANIAGNALLIYAFGLGVAGAAISTLLARIMGAVIMLRLLKDPHPLLRIPSLRKFEWNGAMVRRILNIGVPNGLENGMFQVGKILVQSLVSSLGTVAMTANAITSNLAGFQTIPGSAVSLALITVVGRCVGAKEYGQARRYVVRLMRFSYISMAALAGVILLIFPYIIPAYKLSPDTVDMVWQIMLVYSFVCMILWPASFALPNALRAAGDVRFTMLVSSISMLVFRIAFSYLLVLKMQMGLMGIWVAMMIDWFARSVTFFWRYRSGRWEQMHLL